MLPLTMAKEGDRILVARVGGSEEVKQHLMDLGFVPGALISVVSAPGNGNLIVKVKESRLAITSRMAEKVMVNL